MKRTVELGTLINPAKTVRCGEGNYPVLSMTMHNGLMFQDEKFKKVIASKDTSDYKVVYRNQLVISFPIDEGVLAAQRITDAGIVSPAYGIWDIDQFQIKPEFLEYALRCDRAIQYYKAKLRGSTARRRSLPTPTLLAFTVPLPDIKEQDEILDQIHRAKSIIEKRKDQIGKLDDLIKARFVEMFGDPVVNDRGWQKITLLESLEAGRTVTYGIVQTGDEFENGTPVFRPIDIAGGHVPKREELKKTDPLISAQYKRTLLKGNELLITVRGSVGETFQTTDEFKGCNVGRNIVPLVTDSNKVLQRFLQELFAQDAIKNWLKGITKGIALQGLNMGEFKEMPVIVPPIAMQRAFVVFAMQVDKSKVTVQKALDEAQILFDSLMQQYFG